MKTPKQTARFTLVVKDCGRPEPVTLWGNPRKDKRLQTAVDENRILTVKQETVGTRKDFGVVGFHREAKAAYFVFPKPLDKYEDRKIVGIDYALLDVPPADSRGRGSAKPLGAHRSSRAKAKKPAVPPMTKFRVIVRCVSTMDIPKEVQARNQAEAKEKALTMIAGQKLNFSRGTQSCTAVKTERIRENDSATAQYRRLRGLPDFPDSGRERG